MLMALCSLLLAVHATFHTSFGSELQFISEVKAVHSWQEPKFVCCFFSPIILI